MLTTVDIITINKVPIIIFNSQKFIRKTSKNITGKIRNDRPEKGVRFKLMQIIGLQYINNKDPIFLLWKKHNGEGHFMSLYIKNPNDIKSILTKLI